MWSIELLWKEQVVASVMTFLRANSEEGLPTRARRSIFWERHDAGTSAGRHWTELLSMLRGFLEGAGA